MATNAAYLAAERTGDFAVAALLALPDAGLPAA
jgi:hypothetical protein